MKGDTMREAVDAFLQTARDAFYEATRDPTLTFAGLSGENGPNWGRVTEGMFLPDKQLYCGITISVRKTTIFGLFRPRLKGTFIGFVNNRAHDHLWLGNKYHKLVVKPALDPRSKTSLAHFVTQVISDALAKGKELQTKAPSGAETE